jgi:hypothetical protein
MVVGGERRELFSAEVARIWNLWGVCVFKGVYERQLLRPKP